MKFVEKYDQVSDEYEKEFHYIEEQITTSFVLAQGTPQMI